MSLWRRAGLVVAICLMCLSADCRLCGTSIGVRLLLRLVLWRSRRTKPQLQASLPAGSAYEVEIIPFSFGRCDAMTSTMLPHIALFTSYAVCAIVYVGPMCSANATIKVPVISSFLLQFLQCSLSFLHFCMTMALRRSPVRGLSIDAALS